MLPAFGLIIAGFLAVCYAVWVMRAYARTPEGKRLNNKAKRICNAMAAAAIEENRRLREIGVDDLLRDYEKYWEEWEREWENDPSVPGNPGYIDHWHDPWAKW